MKLLGILTLILAILLFPPAALAIISNNAAPGDVTYPIKRGLEDIIYAVASLTPTTKVWFAAARSDRRFQEVAVLITQGKQAGDTLNELVAQTDIAASQINQITDQKQKEQLVNQLSQSIEKYDQGLQQLTVQPSTKLEVTQPVITPSPISSEPVSSPTPKATPTSTVPPTAPTSLPIVQPAPTPLPTVKPTPRPNRQEEEKEKQRQREIEEARRRLEEIRRRLEEESSRHQINQTQSREKGSERFENRDNEQNSDNKKGDKSDKKEEKSENRKDNKRND